MRTACESIFRSVFITQSVHLTLPATHWNKRVVRLLSQTQISIFVRTACESIFRSVSYTQSVHRTLSATPWNKWPQSVCVRSLPFIANTFENNSIMNFTYCEPQRPGRSSKAILKALLGSGVSNTRYAVGIKIDTVSVQTMICVNNTDISSDTQPVVRSGR